MLSPLLLERGSGDSARAASATGFEAGDRWLSAWKNRMVCASHPRGSGDPALPRALDRRCGLPRTHRFPEADGSSLRSPNAPRAPMSHAAWRIDTNVLGCGCSQRMIPEQGRAGQAHLDRWAAPPALCRSRGRLSWNGCCVAWPIALSPEVVITCL